MTVKPEISVCIFSYNFGKYIEQAIASVLAQKLSVPLEIVIGDDRSTDHSTEIICKYQRLYPGLIRANINAENIGGTRNWLQTINACRGKYIALLDGDDYFIDELKLQKQYDVLEQNGDCALCFHGVRELYEDKRIGEDTDVRFEKNRYSAGEIMEKGWFIRTGSLFFRNGLLNRDLPAWVFKYPYRLDSIIPFFLCIHGDAFYIDEICSVYRRHMDGMSYQLAETQLSDALTRIELTQDLSRFAAEQYSAQSKRRISGIYTQIFFSLMKSGAFLEHKALLLQSVLKMDYLEAATTLKLKLIGTKKT